MPRGGGIEDADDFVLDETQPLGAAPPVPVLQQHRLRDRAGRDHFGLEQLRHRGTEQILAAGMLFGKRIDRGGDPRGIETFVSFQAGLDHDTVHLLTRYRTARTLSREHSSGVTADPCCIRRALSKTVLAAARWRQVFSR